MFTHFHVLCLGYVPVQLSLSLPLTVLMREKKTSGSPHLHNFNACVLEHGRLEKRLVFSSITQPHCRALPHSAGRCDKLMVIHPSAADEAWWGCPLPGMVLCNV